MAERRWPSLDEISRKAKKHVLDDRMAAVPPYELEDGEILGLSSPDQTANPTEKPANPRHTASRR